ncbi:MAG: ThuA domain-containing protein [Pirellulales bacterium]
MLVACALCGSVAAAADAPLAHQEQLAPGVWALGFADKHLSANCGWVRTDDGTWLVDLPRGIAPREFLAAAEKATGQSPTALILTHASATDAPLVSELQAAGIQRVFLSPATLHTLTGTAHPPQANPTVPDGYQLIVPRTTFAGPRTSVELIPLDACATAGALAVYLPDAKTLFAGPAVINGPRVPLPGRDTQAWVAALAALAKLDTTHVVPGFGSWGPPQILDRQRRMLVELRRQVAYFIAQGRPPEELANVVRLVPDYLVWTPYDTPLAEDVQHVYTELTVPHAPFGGRPPSADDQRPHALVLIGDQPHEPGHLEAGLRPVFAATGVVPHFTFDVRALNAENLARVRLLVILRDGLQRPGAGQADYVWMTPEQERAVVDFVERGGGFLNLHNAMGLYPENGPYLNLVGGRYIGHGPLERFRVEVTDREHAITRGVDDFFVADEQHTPPCDEQKVHVLLRNRSDDGNTSAAGWAYEPGQGRLCHLANGHTTDALGHPMYQRLLVNAVRWCVRQEPGN